MVIIHPGIPVSGYFPKKGIPSNVYIPICRVSYNKKGQLQLKNAKFIQFCQDSGIKLEFASPNTPQQIGANERAGRTILNIVRCLLADSTLPDFLWGELIHAAVYLSNRTPHAAVQNGTPYKALYGKDACLGHLRAIGSRAFVHEEPHTKNRSTALGKDGSLETPPVSLSLDARGFEDGECTYDDRNDMVRDVRNHAFNHLVRPTSPNHAVEDPSVADLLEQIRQTTDRDLGFRSAGSPPGSGASGDSGGTVQPDVPKTIEEARASKDAAQWIAAAEREIADLKDRKVYKLVLRSTVPRGRRRINFRWVTQSVRVLLCITVEFDLIIVQMDVTAAFLYADIQEDVYVEQPPGFEVKGENGEDLVMLLQKSLYWLAQSPGNWFHTIDPFLISIGFVPLKPDPCVYFYDHDGSQMYLTLSVDDLLLAGNNSDALSIASLISGMEIKRDRERGTLSISREAYSKSILDRFGMSACKPTSTPGLGPGPSNVQPEETLLNQEETRRYQGIVGCLIYLSQILRYDIMYATSQLARPMAKPSKNHMGAAKRTFRYLAGTTYFKIPYKRGGFKLTAFTDSNWGNNPDNGKSTSSHLTMLCDAPMAFKSGLQSLTTQSTMEVELVAAALAIKEAVFCSNILTELGFGKELAQVPLYGDNTATLHSLGNRSYSSTTKHIALRFFFIRELVSEGRIAIHYVPADSNPADIGTKHLNKDRFQLLLNIIKNFNVNDFINSKFKYIVVLHVCVFTFSLLFR
ncbi:unnamed protein product [Ectocarpus sp. CCAP 1310/34]|nr:unnamed protein product [Ectocarpus sp. CCAP 1310/34]